MVEKKYIKLGVVGLAVVALVVGLSVGITQSRKNKSSSASSASNNYAAYAIDECDSGYSGYSGSAKSGKSSGGGGGSKGSKSGGDSYSGSGKSGKSSRRLVVPGTEDAAAVQSSNQRRKLRNQLVTESNMEEFIIQERFLSYGSYGSYKYSQHSGKSGKASGGGGSKGSKSCSHSVDWCESHDGYPSISHDGSGSGKSGKSSGGGSKGSKSYDGSSDGRHLYSHDSYSGSGKSGKSGGGGSKGSKSNDGSASSGSKGSKGSSPTPYTCGGSSKSGKSSGGGSKGSKSNGGSGSKSSKSHGSNDHHTPYSSSRDGSSIVSPPSPSAVVVPVATPVPSPFVTEPLSQFVFTSPQPTVGGTTTVATEKDFEETQGGRDPVRS